MLVLYKNVRGLTVIIHEVDSVFCSKDQNKQDVFVVNESKGGEHHEQHHLVLQDITHFGIHNQESELAKSLQGCYPIHPKYVVTFKDGRSETYDELRREGPYVIFSKDDSEEAVEEKKIKTIYDVSNDIDNPPTPAPPDSEADWT